MTIMINGWLTWLALALSKVCFLFFSISLACEAVETVETILLFRLARNRGSGIL